MVSEFLKLFGISIFQKMIVQFYNLGKSIPSVGESLNRFLKFFPPLVNLDSGTVDLDFPVGRNEPKIMELANYGHARNIRECAEPASLVLLPRYGSCRF